MKTAWNLHLYACTMRCQRYTKTRLMGTAAKAAAAAAPLDDGPTNILFQGVDKRSTAYKMLASMGWKEGDGLGANKQGIAAHIRVKKNQDGFGVGATEAVNRNRDWTAGMASFDMILANLKAVAAQTAPAAASNTAESPSSSDVEVDDEPDSTPASGAALQPVQQQQQQSMKAKASKAKSLSGSRKHADDSEGSSSDDDGPAVTAVATASVVAPKLATHLGRYAKRERGKRVKGYSSSDLAAILGAAADDASAAAGNGWLKAAAAIRAPHPLDASDSEEEDEKSAAEEGSVERPSTPVLLQDARPTIKASTDIQPETETTPAPKRWWMATFVKAGRMGSVRQELRNKSKPSASILNLADGAVKAAVPSVTAEPAVGANGKKVIKVTGFREQDQEELYAQAHDGATHNKQGLGRSTALKKVGGVNWSGTKTKIGSDDESEEQDGGQGVAADGEGDGSGSDSEEAQGMVILAPKSKQREQVQLQVQAQQQAQAQQAQIQAVASAVVESVAAAVQPSKKRKPSRLAASVAAADVVVSPGVVELAMAASKPSKKQRKAAGSATAAAAGEAAAEAAAAACATIAVSTAAAIGAACDANADISMADAADEETEASPGTAADEAELQPKKKKWRKLLQRILADAPKRRLKLKKLRAQAEAAGLAGQGVRSWEALLSKVQGHASFRTCEKYVRLL